MRFAVPAIAAILFSWPAAGQDRHVDPTWLHRYVPQIEEKALDVITPTCHYKPIFGGGDALQNSRRHARRASAKAPNCQHGRSEMANRFRPSRFRAVPALDGRYEKHAGQNRGRTRAHESLCDAVRAWRHQLSASP